MRPCDTCLQRSTIRRLQNQV